jgi:hypothetical protein
MSKVYKLTTQEMTSHGGFEWKKGEWHIEPAIGQMCQDGWLHAYPHPLIAEFMNPIHANIQEPRFWIAEATGKYQEDGGLKLGFEGLRLVEEIIPPHIDQEHRIRMALMVSLEVCGNIQWRSYANTVIDGKQMKLSVPTNTGETQEERNVRMFAYQSSVYENPWRHTALAMQEAAKIKTIDFIDLAIQAYGKEWEDDLARGRSIYGHAFRQRSK